MSAAAPSPARSRFAPIRSPRAFEEIESQIRKLIAARHLKPGDRLPPERELSVQFDVSRNTLREALRNLEITGLIELRKGSTGGAFISSGKPEVIVNGLADLYQLGAISPQQLTEARIAIESVVVRMACERATEEDLQRLEQAVAASVEAEKSGDIPTRTTENMRFHRLLGAATHNAVLAITMDSIMEVMRQFVGTLGAGVSPNSYVMPSRKRLLAHLRARDADAAEAEMTKHLKRVHKNYLSQLEAASPAPGEK